MKIHTTKCDKCGKTSRECQAEESKTALGSASIFEPEMIRVTMPVSPWWPLGMTATQAQDAMGFDFCSTDCVIQFLTERARTPNDPKLSDRDPEARGCAQRREAKARRVPGFMAGAQAVTEPVELPAARR